MVILGVIALLVVTSLAIVFTRRESAVLDPSTPAGVVQAYSAAVIDGDKRTAETFLSPGGLARCTSMVTSGISNLRVRLLATDEHADTARVRVLIVQGSGGGPFGVSDYESEDAFDLVKIDGKWRIDVAPWQFLACTTTAATP
jgi:hypothetical protein